MILFLRDDKNRTLLDVELFVKTEYESAGAKHRFLELHSTVPIETYSRFLLANQDKAEDIIQIFDELDELRGWMWEQYYMTKSNTGSDEEYQDVLASLRILLKKIATQLHLYYVED